MYNKIYNFFFKIYNLKFFKIYKIYNLYIYIYKI